MKGITTVIWHSNWLQKGKELEAGQKQHGEEQQRKKETTKNGQVGTWSEQQHSIEKNGSQRGGLMRLKVRICNDF